MSTGISAESSAEQPPTTRYAGAADAGALLGLMRQLAVFEGYDDRFQVTEQALLERGLSPACASPQFSAILAEDSQRELRGYAVVYLIAFTYDLKPTLVLKELFVCEGARAAGVGTALMSAVQAHAQAQGCGRLKWDVLPSNERAKAFYRRWGARPDTDWEPWTLSLAAQSPL